MEFPARPECRALSKKEINYKIEENFLEAVGLRNPSIRMPSGAFRRSEEAKSGVDKKL